MRTVTIELGHPVTVDKQKYGQLSLRAPKVRDELAARKNTESAEEFELTLFSNLCEVSRDVIEELEMVDYGKLQAAYRDFLS